MTTVEKIRAGNSNIRNPILVSYVAKGLMPYHGIGSGIQRALAAWPRIEFRNDHEGCLFVATVRRDKAPSEDLVGGEAPGRPREWHEARSSRDAGSVKSSVKSSVKTDVRILELLQSDGTLAIPDLAAALELSTRAIEKQLKALQDSGRLRRIGPDKGGHWEVVS